MGLQRVSDRVLPEAYVIRTNPDDHIIKIEEAVNTNFDHACLCSTSPDDDKTLQKVCEESPTLLQIFWEKVNLKTKVS